MRDLRGAEIALIPQEPMAAFSPVHTVGAQIVEAIMLHERPIDPRREARAKTVELFRDVGISMPEQPHRCVFLAVVRRTAAARDDRDGAVVQAAPADRR